MHPYTYLFYHSDVLSPPSISIREEAGSPLADLNQADYLDFMNKRSCSILLKSARNSILVHQNKSQFEVAHRSLSPTDDKSMKRKRDVIVLKKECINR